MTTADMTTPDGEAVPVFGHDFDSFMAFLNADASPSISHDRYRLVFRIDLQSLAAHARVHRNTINRAPDTETVQAYMRESLRVIRAAEDESESIEKAISWFKNHPYPFSTTRRRRISFPKSARNS